MGVLNFGRDGALHAVAPFHYPPHSPCMFPHVGGTWYNTWCVPACSVHVVVVMDVGCAHGVGWGKKCGRGVNNGMGVCESSSPLVVLFAHLYA